MTKYVEYFVKPNEKPNLYMYLIEKAEKGKILQGMKYLRQEDLELFLQKGLGIEGNMRKIWQSKNPYFLRKFQSFLPKTKQRTKVVAGIIFFPSGSLLCHDDRNVYFENFISEQFFKI